MNNEINQNLSMNVANIDDMIGALPDLPPGSDYDQSTIGPNPDVLQPVFGELNGDPGADGYIAQGFINDRNELTQIGIIGGKAGATVSSDLWVGVCTDYQRQNSPFNDSGGQQWTVSGHLPASALEDYLTTGKIYYMYMDLPQPVTLNSGTTYYLIMATTESYEEEKHWFGCALSSAPYSPGTLDEYDGSNWTALPLDLLFWTASEAEGGCTSPDGFEGDTLCGNANYGQDPTHLYKCSNGSWLDQGYDASCDTGTGCTNPSGAEGQTQCGDSMYGQDPTHLYRCSNGSWLDQGYDASCGGSQNCESITNQSQCVGAGCYWYANYPWETPSCHTNAQDMLMTYLPFIIIGGSVIALVSIGAYVMHKKKKKGKAKPAPSMKIPKRQPMFYLPMN